MINKRTIEIFSHEKGMDRDDIVLYKKTLINEYKPSYYKEENNNNNDAFFTRLLKLDFIKKNINNEEQQYTRINFFAGFPKKSLHCSDMNGFHNFLVEECFGGGGGLMGSISIPRYKLNYQHFCLDFDLKANDKVIFYSKGILTKLGYDNYVKNREKHMEHYYMYNNNNNHIISNTVLDTNCIIYEIIFILTKLLKCNAFSIYILGKGGNFNRGFHVEIPSLIMAYHDIIQLYNFCHNLIQNRRLLDATANYSAFGSCKYVVNNNNSEFDCAYLPYVKYKRGEFYSETSIFRSMKNAFNVFNIFKPINNKQRIFKLPIIIINDDNDKLLKSDDDESDSILEALKNLIHRKKTLNFDWKNALTPFLCSSSATKTTKVTTVNNSSNTCHVGNVIFNNTNAIITKKKIYKQFLPETNSRKIREVYTNIIKIWSDDHHHQEKENGNYHLEIFSVPMYKKINDIHFCFTDEIIDPQLIVNIVDNNDENNKDENDENHYYYEEENYLSISKDKLYPFKIEHILRLLKKDTITKNTILYLLCIFIIACPDEKQQLLLILRWIRLFSDEEKELFLHLYEHFTRKRKFLHFLEEKNKNANEIKTWVILSLKNILIKTDILTIQESIYLLKNPLDIIDKKVIDKYLYSGIFSIQGAVNVIKIPNIICAAILTNSLILFDLISLYRPILLLWKKSDNKNSLIVWCDSNWITCLQSVAGGGNSGGGGGNNNKSGGNGSGSGGSNLMSKLNIPQQLPELYHIATIMNNVANYRESGDLFALENDNNNNDDTFSSSSSSHPPISSSSSSIIISSPPPPNKKRKIATTVTTKVPLTTTTTTTTTSSLSSSKKKKKIIIDSGGLIGCSGNNHASVLLRILNKIQLYWALTYPYPAPSLLLKFVDFFVILGTCQNDDSSLIRISSVLMHYIDENMNLTYPDGLDDLLHHHQQCEFLHKQIFPIFHRILEKTFKTENGEIRKNLNSKTDHIKQQLRAAKELFNDNNNNDDDDEEKEEEPQDEDTIITNQLMREIEYGCSSFTDIVLPTTTTTAASLTLAQRHHHLSKMTRFDHHTKLTLAISQDEDYLQLIRMVKYFVIDQLIKSPKDLKNVYKLLSTDEEERTALLEFNKSEDKRKSVARILQKIMTTHPFASRLLPDIETDDMVQPLCNCPLSRVLLGLLQTFSYDVASIVYVLSLIFITLCHKAGTLKQKTIHFFLGETNSGKTFFLGQILSVLGNLSGILSPFTFNQKSVLDRFHDLAKNCDNARFWYMDEIPQKPFNRQLLNQITGNSDIFIRSNYTAGNTVQLAPTVLFFGNSKPQFTENCPALIERLKYYTFRSRFDSKMPINFKMCLFPKLSQHDDSTDLGMTALLLHILCQRNLNSPLYLYESFITKEIPESTQNITESTIMYSPVSDIIAFIVETCRLEEAVDFIISEKRIAYLISHLDCLKMIKLNLVSDVMRILGERYSSSLVDNEMLEKCHIPLVDLDIHSPSQKTVIYHGLREINRTENDERIKGEIFKRGNKSFLEKREMFF